MSHLLIAAAVIEGVFGLLLIALPARAVNLVLGVALSAPVELVLAQMSGAALLALGVACWLAHNDGKSDAALGLVGGMVVYNAGVAIILISAALGPGLAGILLWPAVVLHVTMTVWCALLLLVGQESTIARVH